MRTTLTLDEDVAERLNRLREERKMSLRDAVNTALRRGLVGLDKPEKQRKRVKIPVVDGGEWLLPDNIVSTHDMLTWSEGEMYR